MSDLYRKLLYDKPPPPNADWFDKAIARFMEIANNKEIEIRHKFEFWELVTICDKARNIIDHEGALVEVDVPVKVVGDIHGQ